MTQAEYNALLGRINLLKAETEDGAITPNRLGTMLIDILSGLFPMIPNMSQYVKISALASYYTKSEIDDETQDLDTRVKEYSDEKVEALAESIAAAYAKKSAIPSLAMYAKKSEIPSLEGYAKLTDIPSLLEYAKKTDLPDTTTFAKATDLTNAKNRITSLEGSIVNLGIKQYSANVNDLTITGRYFVSASATNAPVAKQTYIEVMASSTSFIVQRATDTDGVEYKRVYNGSAWSAWS